MNNCINIIFNLINTKLNPVYSSLNIIIYPTLLVFIFDQSLYLRTHLTLYIYEEDFLVPKFNLILM